MSRTIKAALSSLADTLDDLLRNHRHRAIARELGCAPGTPAARGPIPNNWPIEDLLRLAEQHPSVADALRTLCSAAEAETATTTATAEAALSDLIAGMAGEIQRSIERLKGGLRPDELRATDNELADLQEDIAQARALIRQQRRAAR